MRMKQLKLAHKILPLNFHLHLSFPYMTPISASFLEWNDLYIFTKHLV